MTPVISPSIHLPGVQGAASGARGRHAEPPEGRSFGAALDRSRTASAAGTPESTEAFATGLLAGRKTTRTGEKKTEFGADEVMALLAPLPAPVVPSAAQGQRVPEQTAEAAAAPAFDGLAAGPASTARPGDAAAVADGPTKAAIDQIAAKATANEGTRDAHAAKPAADQADDAGLPLATAVAAAVAAPSSDASAEANAAAPRPAPAVPQASDTPSNAARPVALATNPATTADSAATTLASAAIENSKAQAPTAQADIASIDTAPAPAPQALPTLQAHATAAPPHRAADAAKPAPAMTVAPEIGSSEWGPAIGRHMVRMGTGGQQVAELNLSPAHLGPLKVTLTVGDNQAQAMFVSAHESVRRAVEAALPQLRTTLAEQGIHLGQTSVGAETRQPNSGGHAFADQNPQRPPGPPDHPGSARTDAAGAQPSLAPAAPPPRHATGLDTFA